ncbi:MAE_28990/MAE_18760 family HEPN-like nuclease [Nonomuraea sp. B5E05]|uniref:HEPN domain-containing protein n=1 Tax=Nonomuraea sp. B5E05 TaxID=3153569 RepID=UPI00325FE743
MDKLSDLVDKPNVHSLTADAHSWLCRLLIVRTCGYLEQSTIEICRAYVEHRAGGFVKTFARSWLDKSRNPSPENLTQLVGRFDATLCEEFQSFLEADDQRIYREISFLVDRRNKIAHGLSESVNRAKALQLRDAVYEVTDWFTLRLNPHR